MTGINLDRGGDIAELVRFQEHFHECKIVVYQGLSCDSIMFEERVESPKRINLLYDNVRHHYHVITNIIGAMARRYVCKACNKGCKIDVTHICDQACGDCMFVTPCELSGLGIPCEACNRNFSCNTRFDRHKANKLRGKTVCERKRNCVTCLCPIVGKKHDCFKPYCATCRRNVEIGHLCYMPTLKDRLPLGDYVLYVIYDLKRRRRPKCKIRQHCKFPISCACSNSVRSARRRQT